MANIVGDDIGDVVFVPVSSLLYHRFFSSLLL